MKKTFLTGLCLSLLGAVCLSAVLAAASRSPVADAAMQGDREAVRALLKTGEDVNGAQGDGMTALHWAAVKGDADLAQMLIYAGANVKATTRIGAYSPLYLAAKGGSAMVVATLIAAGADVKATTASGTTPLMIAAAAGDTRTVTTLVENGSDVNATDTAKGETPLMYAAAFNRVEALKLLLQHGADTKLTTKVVDLAALTAPEESSTNRQYGAPAAGRGPAPVQVPGATRAYRYNELIIAQGGLTALQFAAREGHLESATALIDAGADLNQVNPGDKSTPLITAIINGHFDLAKYMIEKGGSPHLIAANGVTPLFAVVNTYWAPKSLYPNPKSYQQAETSYLELMKLLLDKGADPNARVQRKVWYQTYNSDYAGVDEAGATPFWRAAYASDVDAMKLLVSYGADPNIPTMKPVGRPQAGDQVRQVTDVSPLPPVPTGGPGVPPLLAASGVGYGEGFAANSHRYAPTGFLPAIKYLVEELHADVNAIDHEGNTALHCAASRGDTEGILYLVSKGADVTKVNREGKTTADMANGPVQRVQPFPETLAVLEKLGAKNSHKCITC
jgi:ankyrin repeat protein